MPRNDTDCTSQDTLDPSDWKSVRAQGHRMLDDMLDYLQDIRKRPVWQPIPKEVRSLFRQGMPQKQTDLSAAHEIFMHDILPFAVGNAHPRFMGWVHGGGTAVGMLAEMLAAGLNANLGGRDQIPIEVERQITAWMREMFGFPASASGIFVTGTSMANLMAVLVARTCALGKSARQHGIGHEGAALTAYTSKAAHGCIAKAMDIAGFGTDALRCISIDQSHRIDVAALRAQIVRDGERHRQAFAAPAAYLRRETRGLAAGASWPCDLGPDLSRGFRALKTWFTFKTYGTEKLGAVIARTCALAGHLQARILAEPRLELLAPVNLNIVCFRYRAINANKINGDIVIDIQESGIAAPSTTILDGQLAIRAAIVNHRTDARDIDALISAVLEFGAQRSSPDDVIVLQVEPSPPLAM